MNKMIFFATILLTIGYAANAQIPSSLLEKAQSGDAMAQNYVALYYLEGKEIEKDLTKAIMWFKKAIDGKCIIANYNLAMLYENEKNQADAYPLFLNYNSIIMEMIKEKGSIDKQYAPSFCYSRLKVAEYKLYGSGGIEKDLDGAIKLYNDLKKNFGLIAYLNIVRAYKEKEDYENAFANILVAVELYPNPSSTAILASFYSDGIGCQKDYDKALELLTPIVGECEEAQFVLADLYCKPDYAYHNYDQAFKLYSKLLEKADNSLAANEAETQSAEYRNSKVLKGKALRKLSKCYRFGRGVKKDISKAEALLKEAAHYGNEDAKSLLDLIMDNL